MASYKDFLPNEIVQTKTLLHEAIPITGTIISGSYSGANIKKFSHGLFETIYDYPFASSSANPLFDLTVGYTTASAASASAVVANNLVQSKKKINLYNQMAKVLIGHDTDGSILALDQDGNFDNSGDILHNCFFINFSRVLVKDEIKKGSFRLDLGVGPTFAAPFANVVTITDSTALTSYGVNSPVGEYGILTADSIAGGGNLAANKKCGIIFYQAGIAAIKGAVFAVSSSNLPTANLTSSQQGLLVGLTPPILSGSLNYGGVLASGTIGNFNDGVERRIQNVQLNNTTELNSTIYFCKIPSNEFNYSSNETYVSGSKIVVKSRAAQDPVAYFTTVGLYSAQNELLAVAKLSEPIKKDPNTELTLRVRLDF